MCDYVYDLYTVRRTNQKPLVPIKIKITQMLQNLKVAMTKKQHTHKMQNTERRKTSIGRNCRQFRSIVNKIMTTHK